MQSLMEATDEGKKMILRLASELNNMGIIGDDAVNSVKCINKQNLEEATAK